MDPNGLQEGNFMSSYRALHNGYQPPNVDIPWSEYGKGIYNATSNAFKAFQNTFLRDACSTMSTGEKIQSQMQWYVNMGGLNNLPGIAKSTAIIAGASEAVLWGPVVYPIILNKILTDPQGSLDFITSMFPGTTPAMNWPGVYGAATGKIIGSDKW